MTSSLLISRTAASGAFTESNENEYECGRSPPSKPFVKQAQLLQAIAAGKKKNDRVDARKIADLLRCDYFPECHMASREIRDRRRVLRYRNLLVRQAVQMKNKVSGLLMEAGVPYNRQKVHQTSPNQRPGPASSSIAQSLSVFFRYKEAAPPQKQNSSRPSGKSERSHELPCNQ